MTTHRRPLRTGAVAVAVALAVAMAACSGGDGATPVADPPPPTDEGVATTFPGDEWDTADPEELGFDPARLEELAAEAEAAASTCLMVVRHGRVVGEWYWNDGAADSPQEVFSVTKSLTSTLVGLAVADGALSLGDRAVTHVPEWEGTDSEAVTIRNLVANDSGREWSLGIDYGTLPGEADRNSFAVGLGQDAPPGETWVYNNSAIQTLSQVLEAATGVEPADYAAERIFEPIGMGDSAMGRDRAGNTATFMGLSSTCADLARFGHLALNGGSWDDEQIVPTEWLDEATGGPSTELNAGYGYLWWLNRDGPQAGAVQAVGGDEDDAAEDGQLVDGAPEDRYWALGLGDQIVQVDPGSDTVVVRLGPPVFGERDGPVFDTAAASRIVDEALVDGGS